MVLQQTCWYMMMKLALNCSQTFQSSVKDVDIAAVGVLAHDHALVQPWRGRGWPRPCRWC